MTHSHDTATPALSVESEYVLVPREPTDEMIRAALAVQWPATYRHYLRHPQDGEGSRKVTEERIESTQERYRAMIAAAPAPNPSPAAKGGEAGALAALYQTILNMPRRREPISGQTFSYVQLDEVLAHVEQAAALPTPSPQPAEAVREALLNARKALLSEHWHEKSQLISQIDAALASDPAPAGEAVEPVGFINESFRDGLVEQKGKGYWHHQMVCGKRFDGSFPIYLARPASEDTARLWEDLERVTRERDSAHHAMQILSGTVDVRQRERDDARKALETAAEDERDRLLEELLNSCMGPTAMDAINRFLREHGAMFLEDRAAARSASREGASDE